MFGDYYAWSPEYSFVSAPKAGADVTTTVISFGGKDIACSRCGQSWPYIAPATWTIPVALFFSNIGLNGEMEESRLATSMRACFRSYRS